MRVDHLCITGHGTLTTCSSRRFVSGARKLNSETDRYTKQETRVYRDCVLDVIDSVVGFLKEFEPVPVRSLEDFG